MTWWRRLVAGINRQALGRAGEDLALAHLQSHGLRLVQRNFRCRRGEIDLIMQDGEQLIFVEVRARQHASHGGAAASVTGKKQQKLIITAQYYLQRYANRPPRCRFDVVAIDGEHLQWLRDIIQTT